MPVRECDEDHVTVAARQIAVGLEIRGDRPAAAHTASEGADAPLEHHLGGDRLEAGDLDDPRLALPPPSADDRAEHGDRGNDAAADLGERRATLQGRVLEPLAAVGEPRRGVGQP